MDSSNNTDYRSLIGGKYDSIIRDGTMCRIAKLMFLMKQF